ncbi:MAG: CoB--CoM heterodisulfide reductase iron-sulfur subunit A family protein [Halobacteriota archaeon]|nr:CoB--CoM heterodisulfide reductase iron-sulfur subunit A family protein [Halobacteriota archaeon]
MDEKIGAVLVVGGGIAGMQASLDLAESGFKVYLLEKSPGVGGTMAQLDKTFPTNDCSMCILSPKLVAVGSHQNIDILANAEIEGVGGEAGNFKVAVKIRPRHVNLEKCTGCGVCVQRCPVEAINEYEEGMALRSAVYIKYPQMVPLVATIDRDKCLGCGLCQELCVADAIEYNQTERIAELNVGSIILSPGFDEFDPSLMAYGYGIYPNVIISTEFERILSATGPFMGSVSRPSDGQAPKKIAFIQCVGSRNDSIGKNYCSSVCCTYAIKEAIIAKEHSHKPLDVSIFYMDMRTQGKGFDEFYNRAKDEYGVRFVRCKLPTVESIPGSGNLMLRYVEGEELKEEEFDLVVLSVGFNPPAGYEKLRETLGIELDKYGFCDTEMFTPLETSREGIYACGAFTGPKDIPESVAQASGAASKASGVISSERGALVIEKEYPVEKEVFRETPRIGVFVCKCGINIAGVVDVPSVVEYAKTLPNVEYAEFNLYTCSQETQERIKKAIVEYNLNRVLVASCTPRTHEPLFRNTCKEGGLNQYLFELVNIRDHCSWVHSHEPERATEKAKALVRMAVHRSALLEPLQKVSIGVTPSAMVIGGGIAGMTCALEFAKQGYEVDLVEKEGELGGNLRKIRYLINKEDPKERLDSMINTVNSNENIHVHPDAKILGIEGYIGNFKTRLLCDGEEKTVKSGVIVVATGGIEYEPAEYLYGEDERIITQLRLEEKMAESELDVNDVVMIQCVGSRNKERPYCSKVCCTEAIKNALEIKERNPETDIFVLYRDIRTYGLKEDYYKEAQEKGVNFIRFDEEREPEVFKEDGKLKVIVRDATLDKNILLEPDLLVLSTAILPQPDNEDLSKMLKVPINSNRFFLEAHVKLRPIDFSTDGIFLCGVAHSPKPIDEAISQASGVVSRACTILSKDEVKTEGSISHVNEDLCISCERCYSVCPYEAIEMTRFNKARVIDAVCKGCGVCACTCPAVAIDTRHFKNDQIVAQLEGLLEG